MDLILIIVIVAVCISVLILCVGCYNFIVRKVIITRRQYVGITVPIKYMPKRVVVKEVFERPKKAYTKRDRRKLMVKRDMIGIGTPIGRISPNSSVGRLDSPTGWLTKYMNSNDDDGDEGLSSKHNLDIEEGIESPSQKRRKKSSPSNKLLRAMARFKASNDMNDSSTVFSNELSLEEEENAITILDLEPLRQKTSADIVDKRKSLRLAKKMEMKRQGKEDPVERNSGPPLHLIPEGYSVSTDPPTMTVEYLRNRRVMCLWENGKKAQGWYLGTVGGYTKVPGCTFTIKYDRAETKNIFVDGLVPSNIALSGEGAYGRRWVLLNPTDPNKIR